MQLISKKSKNIIHGLKVLNSVLFSLGILVSTFTELRLKPSFGYGELIILISFMITVIIFFFEKEIIFKVYSSLYFFWISMFLLFILGVFAANSLVPNFNIENILHDLLAYLYIFVFIVIHVSMLISNKELHRSFLKSYIFCSLIYFLFLTYIKFSDIFFVSNISMFYGLRLIGFSSNPNQLAAFCCIFPFLSLNLFFNSNNILEKILGISSLIFSSLVGFFSLSDGLIVSWVVAFVFLLFQLIISYFKKSQHLLTIKNIVLFFFVITGIIMFLNYYYIFVREGIDDIYDNGGQGDDRINRWIIALKTLNYSPLFGFGPGSYGGRAVSFENEEVHNTYLDLALNAGILGVIIFLLLLFDVFRSLGNNKFLKSGLLALCVCIVFNFYLRHPFFWVNIMILLSFLRLKKRNSNYV